MSATPVCCPLIDHKARTLVLRPFQDSKCGPESHVQDLKKKIRAIYPHQLADIEADTLDGGN